MWPKGAHWGFALPKRCGIDAQANATLERRFTPAVAKSHSETPGLILHVEKHDARCHVRGHIRGQVRFRARLVGPLGPLATRGSAGSVIVATASSVGSLIGERDGG